MIARLKLKRILIVDDDSDNGQLLQEALSSENWQVAFVTSGLDAIEKCNQWSPDLILMDYDMPGLSGLETMTRIRGQHPGTDVLFISANASPQIVSQTLETGADDYLRKPFSMIELFSRVRVRFRLRDLRAQLTEANEKLYELSVKDDLTGLSNMRAIYQKVKELLERCDAEKQVAVGAMIDMDHFKRVNDEHDHLFGSFVLSEMGKILRARVREDEIGARYGGDEFLIVLSGRTDFDVIKRLQELRESVEKYEFVDGADSIRMTISVGAVKYFSKLEISSKEFVRLADHALYEAKKTGRNKIAMFDEKSVKNYLDRFRNEVRIKKAS